MSVDAKAMVEALGWVATATFVASYFFSSAERLVRAQMLGAVLWVGYGVLLGAKPVVAANLLVLGAAGWKSWRASRATAVARPGGV